MRLEISFRKKNYRKAIVPVEEYCRFYKQLRKAGFDWTSVASTFRTFKFYLGPLSANLQAFVFDIYNVQAMLTSWFRIMVAVLLLYSNPNKCFQFFIPKALCIIFSMKKYGWRLNFKTIIV